MYAYRLSVFILGSYSRLLIVGVEPISTLLGKVLMGYELDSNSRHYCTHLPADIARYRPACSPYFDTDAFRVFERFGRGRCAIPHLVIN